MYLNPEQIRENGIIMNSYILPAAPPSAKVLGIEVTQFDKVVLSSFMSQSEFFTHRVINEELKPFNYVIDNIGCWKLFNDRDIIRILIVGEEGKSTALKLTKKLCGRYKLGLNQITLNFYDRDFIQDLVNNLSFKQSEPPKPKPILKPKLTYSLHTLGEWRNIGAGATIDLIKISITNADFRYRVYTKGKWLSWTNNGEIAGIPNYPIQGFQFEFKHQKYEFLYCATLLDRTKTKWRNTSMKNPYQKKVINFDFKVQQIN